MKASAPTEDRWYRYEALGVSIRSALALPDLVAAKGDGDDIEIVQGTAPEKLPRAADTGLRYQTMRNQALIEVDSVARYFISKGERIVIDAPIDRDEGDVRLFLLEAALRCVLQQREDFVLRGSAVDVRGGARLFLGPSGVGKSTTALALMAQGHAVLTDDVCVLRSDATGTRYVQPSWPFAAAWPDSLRQLGMRVQELKRVSQQLNKRVVPLERFAHRPVPVAKIYFLRNTNNPERPTLTQLDAKAAVNILAHHAQLNPLLKGSGLLPLFRQMASTLAQAAPVAVIDRPRTDFQLERLVDLLEDDFRQ